MKFVKLLSAYFNPEIINNIDWGDINHKYWKSIAYIVIGFLGMAAIQFFELERGSLHLFALSTVSCVLIIFGMLLFLSAINDFLDKHVHKYVKKALLYLTIGLPLFLALLYGAAQ